MTSLLKFTVFLFENVQIVLPFSIFYRALYSSKPFIENFFLVKAYMNRSRLFIGVIIDSFEDKAIILLILRQPEQIIFKIICPYPRLFLSKQHMPFWIQPKYLLLPSLDIETARVAGIIDKVTTLDGWWLEDISNEISDIPQYPYIILHFLLSTQRPECFYQLLR